MWCSPPRADCPLRSTRATTTRLGVRCKIPHPERHSGYCPLAQDCSARYFTSGFRSSSPCKILHSEPSSGLAWHSQRPKGDFASGTALGLRRLSGQRISGRPRSPILVFIGNRLGMPIVNQLRVTAGGRSMLNITAASHAGLAVIGNVLWMQDFTSLPGGAGLSPGSNTADIPSPGVEVFAQCEVG